MAETPAAPPVGGRTVVLRLSGPMQAWGEDGRFGDRPTAALPTRSAVLGLVASALGRDRADDISDLLTLHFGIRLDQPGEERVDFQTARASAHDPSKQAQSLTWPFMVEDPQPTISRRHYLHDACVTVALRGDAALVTEIEDALFTPARPLYLGRRSCPLTEPPLLSGPADATGLAEMGLLEALRAAPVRPTFPEGTPREVTYELDAQAADLAELPAGVLSGVRTDVPAGPFSARRYRSRDVWRWREALRPEVPVSAPRVTRLLRLRRSLA